ncbi:glycosyltransferase family 2 protein [Rhodoluna sp.]|uniref:glycosyltransferase family 2 protein n=1 Tax=Rhodoluna sp. TaxID=1969481 RepID=UPI0025CE284B|nr:glycosyltransferase family 2 protein [Rhodoluna sp.]
MKPLVTAVIVSHDEAGYFAATLEAVQSQTRAPNQIVLIDTSTTDECATLAEAQGVTQITKLSNKATLSQILAAARASSLDAEWFWFLHDDSAPKPDALNELLRATELSPSVAIAGPKQVDWNDNRIVTQQGLTLTPMGDLFSMVRGELDQGQHDDVDDVLAVGTAGALIRLDVFDELSGFDSKAPALASDIDYSIRVRLAGHRVIVVPQAKVAHAGLSMQGKRPRRWLGTSPKAALRRSAIHLRLAYAPLPSALLFWLFLPLISLVRVFWRVATKRPDRLWSEITAGLWGYFTLFSRLSSRAKISKTSKFKFSKLKALRATTAQVRQNNRAQLDHEETQAKLAAFESGESESFVKPAGFVASGAIWISLALAALNVAFWPGDVAAAGGGLLPLSSAWLELFAHAGASYQPIGFGFYGPSDPFVWVLTFLSAFTFWSPSLAMVILIWLAKVIAFAGAWRVVSLFSNSALVRNLAALVFALWPVVSQLQSDARSPGLIATLALPWLIYAAAVAAGFSRRSLTSSQTWVWVGVSGLLLAIVAASSPNLLPILALVFLVILFAKVRKFGYLIWIPLPTAALFGPSVLYYLSLWQPLAIFADPGLPQASTRFAIWQILLGGSSRSIDLGAIGAFSFWVAAVPVALALLALLTRKALLSLIIWIVVLVIATWSYVVENFDFVAVGIGSATFAGEFVNGSPFALMTFAALGVVVLIAILFEALNSTKLKKVLAVLLTILAIVPAAAMAATAVNPLSYNDGRVVPSIVAAEAEQGSQLNLLVINPIKNAEGKPAYAAELVAGDGVQLEDVSLGYRFAVGATANGFGYELIARRAQAAELVADLVSANGKPLQAQLDRVRVGYVLLPTSTSEASGDLAIGLDSIKELEAVGITEFGKLWRVKSPDQALQHGQPVAQSMWSITKAVQLAVLLAFILLALPTSRAARAKQTDSAIFVEAGEDN